MERDAIQPEDEGSVALLEGGEGGAAGRPSGRGAKQAALHKLQLVVPWKTVVTLGEIHLKRLKKGQDMSRGHLICEAIELLAERETATKSTGKTEEAAAR